MRRILHYQFSYNWRPTGIFDDLVFSTRLTEPMRIAGGHVISQFDPDWNAILQNYSIYWEIPIHYFSDCIHTAMLTAANGLVKLWEIRFQLNDTLTTSTTLMNRQDHDIHIYEHLLHWLYINTFVLMHSAFITRQEIGGIPFVKRINFDVLKIMPNLDTKNWQPSDDRYWFRFPTPYPSSNLSSSSCDFFSTFFIAMRMPKAKKNGAIHLIGFSSIAHHITLYHTTTLDNRKERKEYRTPSGF